MYGVIPALVLALAGHAQAEAKFNNTNLVRDFRHGYHCTSTHRSIVP